MQHVIDCCPSRHSRGYSTITHNAGRHLQPTLHKSCLSTWPCCAMQAASLCMQAGALEIFLDNLPGFPDGVSRASDGNFWVAINSAPVPKVVGVTMGSRFLRWVVGWVPALAGELHAYGLILKVSHSSNLPSVWCAYTVCSDQQQVKQRPSMALPIIHHEIIMTRRGMAGIMLCRCRCMDIAQALWAPGSAVGNTCSTRMACC